ncbi:MAG: thiamine biosynthesis protein ThiS [Candidatus Woesearchaeota archaeon]|nr:thiamine biosynthesis protein ThiS [Candidatus Woesearchaeota archaeon]
MEVFIEKEQKRLELEFTGTAKELLEKIDVNPETVLIVADGTLITEEDEIKAKKIELLSVISGG